MLIYGVLAVQAMALSPFPGRARRDPPAAGSTQPLVNKKFGQFDSKVSTDARAIAGNPVRRTVSPSTTATVATVRTASRKTDDPKHGNVPSARRSYPRSPTSAYAREFWSVDFSCGAGCLSSPVAREHISTASELAVFAERRGASLARRLPRWLLLSIIGIATRELTSRQVRERLLPQLNSEAQVSAGVLEETLRRNFDARVTRTLSAGGFGNAQRMVEGFIAEEMRELESTVTSLEDLIESEVLRSILTVVDLEINGRIEQVLSRANTVNMTKSDMEISALLAAADKNGDGYLTFDELVEFMSGRPMNNSFLQSCSQWAVLTAPELAANWWEKWASLIVAPWIGRLSRTSRLAREIALWCQEHGHRRISAGWRLTAERVAPQRLKLSDAFQAVLGRPPTEEMLRANPSLFAVELRVPTCESLGETAMLVKNMVLNTTRALSTALAAVDEPPAPDDVEVYFNLQRQNESAAAVARMRARQRPPTAKLLRRLRAALIYRWRRKRKAVRRTEAESETAQALAQASTRSDAGVSAAEAKRQFRWRLPLHRLVIWRRRERPEEVETSEVDVVQVEGPPGEPETPQVEVVQVEMVPSPSLLHRELRDAQRRERVHMSNASLAPSAEHSHM